MAENSTDSAADLIALAGDITIAWLQNPNVHPGAQDVPSFLKSMHAAISELGTPTTPEPEVVTYEPAVSIRSSVKHDHLVSLIDGKKYKTLKRHLSFHGLTPDSYRARFGLKADYPMVAESYAAQRRDIAKSLGLGRRSSTPAKAVPDAPTDIVADEPASSAATPKARVRKPKVDAVNEVVTPAPAKVKKGTLKVSTPAPAEAVGALPVEARKAPAKPKRMARTPATETSGEQDITQAVVETPAKPKRAAGKLKPSPSSTPSAQSAKTPRAKKAKTTVSSDATAKAADAEATNA